MRFNAEQFGLLATDRELEELGVRIRLDSRSDVWFDVRRPGGANHAYDRAISKARFKFRKELNLGTLDNDVARIQILLPAFVQACVVDWGGVRDDDGDEIPFSVEACTELFTEFPDVFDAVYDTAQELSTYRRGQQEEVIQALEKP